MAPTQRRFFPLDAAAAAAPQSNPAMRRRRRRRRRNFPAAAGTTPAITATASAASHERRREALFHTLTQTSGAASAPNSHPHRRAPLRTAHHPQRQKEHRAHGDAEPYSRKDTPRAITRRRRGRRRFILLRYCGQ